MTFFVRSGRQKATSGLTAFGYFVSRCHSVRAKGTSLHVPHSTRIVWQLGKTSSQPTVGLCSPSSHIAFTAFVCATKQVASFGKKNAKACKLFGTIFFQRCAILHSLRAHGTATPDFFILAHYSTTGCQSIGALSCSAVTATQPPENWRFAPTATVRSVCRQTSPAQTNQPKTFFTIGSVQRFFSVCFSWVVCFLPPLQPNQKNMFFRALKNTFF
jgi:hypothetical protein